MAEESGSEPPGRNWQLFESILLLRKCLRTTIQRKMGELKRAVVENNFNKVCILLEGGDRRQLNTRWSFSADRCTLHVPPLCVAVCHQNVPMIQRLLQCGANPNRTGRICVRRQGSSLGVSAYITPLMMAMEDHPSEGLPFDPAVASALLDAGADINSTVASEIEEEEEEGGSIHYSVPKTLLHKSVHMFLPYSSAVFSFLLDNGADLFITDSENNYTPLQKCLHGLVERPEDVRLGVCAEELIRRGGFKTHPRLPFPSVSQTEFGLLMEAMTRANVNKRNMSAIEHRAHLLLDAGYVCSEDDIANLKNFEIKNIDPCLADKVYGLHVYTLKHLCRIKIRKSVQHLNSLDKLAGLPLSVIDYLKMR